MYSCRQDDIAHLAVIRRFFLEPQETYSRDELSSLWGVSLETIDDVYHEELSACELREGTPDGTRFGVAWADVLTTSVTFNLLRPRDIERALGAEFARFRPECWRTVPIRIRLPQFVVGAIMAEASLLRASSLSARVEQFILEFFIDAHRGAEA